MKDAHQSSATNSRGDSRRPFWYGVLNVFPFVFLPLVALIGVLCALIMPWLTNAYVR